jgi:uncharacterized protein involved in exopolysaccharide biosynthesis
LIGVQKSVSNSEWSRAAPVEAHYASPAGAPGPAQGDFLDLRRILRIVVRERWLIGGPIVIAVLAVLLYAAFSPVRYTAVAQLIVGSEKPALLRGDNNETDIGRYLVGPVIDSEVEIIQSTRISERAIRQFNLLPDLEVGEDKEPGLLSSVLGIFSSSEGEPGPSAEETMASAVSKLQQWLDVRRKGLTLIILVQYSHADAKIAAKVANAIVKSYLEEQTDSKARVTQSVAEKLRLRVSELRKELYSAELRLEEYKEKSLAKNDVNLFELERQAKVTSDLYLSLLARLSEAEAAKGLIYADARVVAQASEPQDASVPGKLIPLMLALMGGLGIGVALALIKDHLSTTIRHPDDAASALGIPIIGSTPLLHTDRETITREVLTDRSSLFSQSIFSIKHSLLGGGGRPAPQLIAFVSALPGEGKSVLAANFAHYAASSGMKTLLVDCNLREPQLTMLLAPASKKSFVDLAKREAEMDDVLVRDTDSGLYFCPGQHGEFSGNPMEILASQEMVEFLGACRQVFDLIVLDTSALLPVVDARALVRSVDVAVLVLECGRTSTDDAKQALWTEPTLVAKACAVLNKST